MQINTYWQKDHFNDPVELLGAQKNIDTGAKVLSQNLIASNYDLRVAIGRYNTWSNTTIANAYADQVLAIYTQLT